LQRETSIDDQVAVATRYAQAQGWTLLSDHIYTDAAISGASLDRPGIHALRATAARRPVPFDVLLVDDSSRISRDLADAVRLLQELKFNGVRVLYLSQHIDSNDEQADTLIAVHGIVDSLYLREMAKKTKRGLVGQLERGFATGSRTYGYRTIPVPDPSGKNDSRGNPALLGKRIEIHQDEARVIVQIFEWYASGLGVSRIIDRLRETRTPGPRGQQWKSGSILRLLRNEKFLGQWIWGQKVFERRPGSRQRMTRAQPRDRWHVKEQPALRIVSGELWRQVQARRAEVSAAVPMRADGRRLMRGRHGTLHSKHLFVGFMRCSVCGGAVTCLYGRPGAVRYGCSRSQKDGVQACDNRLTVRSQVVDTALLAGLRLELRRPETVQYVVGALTQALNRLIDERPRVAEEVRLARDQAVQRLQRLITAIEQGVEAYTLSDTIRARQADVARLEAQLADLAEPLVQRLAIIPGWVEQQLLDLEHVLGETPERAKLEFQRLGLRVIMQPIREEGTQPFYRAVGHAALPGLTGTVDLRGQISDLSRR
jgi:DNA invertase Pin-like site-specific DNA recombinase